MNNDNKTALVLEGGGLRGVFTCGVLFLWAMVYGRRLVATNISPDRATTVTSPAFDFDYFLYICFS